MLYLTRVIFRRRRWRHFVMTKFSVSNDDNHLTPSQNFALGWRKIVISHYRPTELSTNHIKSGVLTRTRGSRTRTKLSRTRTDSAKTGTRTWSSRTSTWTKDMSSMTEIKDFRLSRHFACNKHKTLRDRCGYDSVHQWYSLHVLHRSA